MDLPEGFGEFGLGVIVDTTAKVFQNLLPVTPAHRQNIGEAECSGITRIERLEFGVFSGATLIESGTGLFTG